MDILQLYSNKKKYQQTDDTLEQKVGIFPMETSGNIYGLGSKWYGLQVYIHNVLVK